MPMFKHILFPIDFYERCRSAEPFVASMAQRFNARLTLIHVVNIPAGWYGSMEAPYPVMFDIPEMLQAGKTQLNAFVAERELARADRVV